MTPFDLLRAYPDRTQPLVTHYDGPVSRVELSVATLGNAVAKAAGLLRDGLGLSPGSVVSIDLPLHWQVPVWTCAALAVGAQCGRALPDHVDVRIVGSQGLAAVLADGPGVGLTARSSADEVLACSCDAFGLPVPGGVPPGVIDVGVEVRAYPDAFSPEPSADRARVLHEGAWLDWSAIAPAPKGSRLWVDEATPPDALLVSCAIAPLLGGASVVIGTGLAHERAGAIRAAEGVTGRA